MNSFQRLSGVILPPYFRGSKRDEDATLGNLWRRLVLPKRIEKWSLTSLLQRLVKTGGRLIKHARYYWLLLAESHAARVWKHAAADGGFAAASRIGSAGRRNQPGRGTGAGGRCL
jgi:hypothetical protein